MASYYYLISSLPSLRSNAPMPFDYGTFLKMCKSAVSAPVYENLESLSADCVKGPMGEKWADFYQKLKTELNCNRKEKLGKPFSRPFDRDFSIQKVASDAMNASTPLEAEKILLNAEFEYLDSLVSMHYFDDTVLYGYALKLRLLERQNVFDFAEGSKEFKRLFDGIQHQIQSI